MKHALTVLALLAGLTCAAAAQTAPAPTQYSIQTSTLGQLIANPATKTILEKDFPEIASHPQLNEGLDLTIPEVVQYLPDVVTPEKMAAMDAELKALPQ